MQIRPKKKLGQNFLIDPNIGKKIIECSNLGPKDMVLEIGAGRGEVTRLIAGKVKKVYALEIDPLLCKVLKQGLGQIKNIEVINRDILRYKLRKESQKFKVLGNIPYYITTPILEFILKNRKKISAAYITVQKEFAKRITASPGRKAYGALSCFVQFYGSAKILFPIKKACFWPPPEVDSCFLELKLQDTPRFKIKSEKFFFMLTRAAFNKRRKILKNSLAGLISSEKLDGFFRQYNIDRNIRPECLSLADFARLSNYCN